MRPPIADIVKRHGGTPELAAELEAILDGPAGSASGLTTLWDGVDPVELEPEPDAPDAPEADRDAASDGLIAGRYRDLGPIAQGGMGEVRRVRDTELNRTLAMKIIHAPLMDRHSSLTRFLEEAQATAQLQHPHIVPVHDIGQHADGRVWFTMKEVRGRTLTDVIRALHEASDSQWRPTADGWTFKRVITAFLGVCHAIAYAHERGVLHRDLKPDNVMVGRHGEVYVLDWGLAKVFGRDSQPRTPSADGPPLDEVLARDDTIVSHRSDSDVTRMGTVAGTPAYMAPEQARGDTDAIDTRTDVYALGAILYEILSCRPPYKGEDGFQTLAQVLAGPPRTVGRLTATSTFNFGDPLPEFAYAPPLPEALVEACNQAMSRLPEHRHPSAQALADEISTWLEGARQRAQALAITESALSGSDQAVELREQARLRELEGRALLKGIAGWQPEEDKVPGWQRLDQAADLRRTAELRELEVDQGLHGALRVMPQLPEAHAALAKRYQMRHARAEAERDAEAAARAESLLRFHSESLPEGHTTRLQCAAYLRGRGALTLVTDPPGAEVTLYAYEAHHRRLVEKPVGALGRTPLAKVSLPMGSYLCVITHPERETVRYPVHLQRLHHWDGVAPGDTRPTPVWLPPRGWLAPDEVLVPPGWFLSGGDTAATNHHEGRRLWCDGLVMQRFPTTAGQYVAFLNDLVAQGRTEHALEHAPRDRDRSLQEDSQLLFSFDGTRFGLQKDSEGDGWLPDYPVLYVDRSSAIAYLEWKAARTGRPWRLPHELEWEKAARGVDGRWYPWGDHFDASRCCVGSSHQGPRRPAVVDAYPLDCSPYGVRGVSGNATDWCANPYEEVPPPSGGRVPIPDATPPADGLSLSRGGVWGGAESVARLGLRNRLLVTARTTNLGFRGVHRLP